jgi:hypothetical protein
MLILKGECNNVAFDYSEDDRRANIYIHKETVTLIYKYKSKQRKHH